jgi:hypothetical protein
MSESVRLTDLLRAIIGRLKHRNVSTKVQWMNFSNGIPITRETFEQLITTYGLSIQPGDLDIIWESIGMKGDVMGYADFVRFISLDRINNSIISTRHLPPLSQSPNIDSVPTYQNDIDSSKTSQLGRRCRSLSEILTNHIREIGNGLLSLDREFTGFVSINDFELILQVIDNINESEIKHLIARYDTRNTGIFNYFMLLADICNRRTTISLGMNQFSQQIGFDEHVRQPSIETIRRHSEVGIDFTKNDLMIGRPHASAPAPVLGVGTFMKRPSRTNEIVQTIATRMTDVFESSAKCFNKWRGQAPSIGPYEFMTGAKRDFKIEVTIDEAQEIINQFGILTLGGFLKMIGAGSDAVSNQQKTNQSRELDDNEKTLQHFARQAKGKNWEPIFQSGLQIEQIVPSLKRMSIYVLGPDLMSCFTKYGKDGMIQKIHDFIATL